MKCVLKLLMSVILASLRASVYACKGEQNVQSAKCRVQKVGNSVASPHVDDGHLTVVRASPVAIFVTHNFSLPLQPVANRQLPITLSSRPAVLIASRFAEKFGSVGTSPSLHLFRLVLGFYPDKSIRLSPTAFQKS